MCSPLHLEMPRLARACFHRANKRTQMARTQSIVGRNWGGAFSGRRLAALPLILVFAWTAPAESRIERLANGQLQVGLDGTSGQLIELIDPISKRNLIDSKSTTSGVWELHFEDLGIVSPEKASAFDISPLAQDQGGLRLRWSQFGFPTARDLRVEVDVRMETNRPLSRWGIAVHNLNGRMPRLIKFPVLPDVAAQAGERLAVPVWLGQETASPRTQLLDSQGNPRRWEWSYPGILSMQCLALSTPDGAGLYIACDDTAGHLKDFAVFGGGETGLNLEIVHELERRAPSDDRCALPYSVSVGAFQGGWFEAATLYRSWATNQTWAGDSRLRRGLVPSWVTNTALWVWNRGPSSGVIEPAIALRKELGLPISVFWHWWHGCAYDVGFPEYLPPREGEAPFKAALQRAHEHDIHAIVYMNQRLWGMTTASWTNEGAIRFAVKAADGQVRPEVYNTFTRSPCASMCMGTEFWRNKYAGLAVSAVGQLGVDGIYMDQACSSLACFDPRHGHPQGGGTYWMKGFKMLAEDILRRCATCDVPALAGEGCAENWLPRLDLMLSLQVSRERYAGPDGWDVIPFFHAVYHPCGIFYGNYSSLTMPPYDELWPAEFAPKEPLEILDRKFSQQFLLEQARAFVWGQQPTIANFTPRQLSERDDEIAFVLRVAKVRRQALPYLQNGIMLTPPAVEVPQVEIPMSRLSIYAGQRGGLKEFKKVVAPVLAAAWLSPDKSIAIAVASISDEELRPLIRLHDAAFWLPDRGTVCRIDERGRTDVGQVVGTNLVLRPCLAPRDVCLLRLTRP